MDPATSLIEQVVSPTTLATLESPGRSASVAQPAAGQHARVGGPVVAAPRQLLRDADRVYRGPYEYSVPGRPEGDWPQNAPAWAGWT